MKETESKSITKAEINELPLIFWEGPVKIVETTEEAEKLVPQLNREQILGFDTETRPAFKKGQYYPPALVQLATAETVFLFRISQMGTFEPLIPIFENANVIKTGVGLTDDVKELRKLQEFSPAGFLDLTKLTVPLGYVNRGLRPLCGLLLNGRISKAAQVSNWARPVLEPKQIQYAATDAWVSRQLYLKAVEAQKLPSGD